MGAEHAFHVFFGASQVFNKPKISTGKKIDMIMDKIRVALFWKDQEAIKENLETAKKLIEDVCTHIFLSLSLYLVCSVYTFFPCRPH